MRRPKPTSERASGGAAYSATLTSGFGDRGPVRAPRRKPSGSRGVVLPSHIAKRPRTIRDMSTEKQRDRLRRTITELLAEPNFEQHDVASVLYDLDPRYVRLLWAEEDVANERRRQRRQLLGARPVLVLECQVCHRGFTARRRDARTCSDRCRQRAWRLSHLTP